MAIGERPDVKHLLIDKRKLQQSMDELNERMGFVRDPTATAERAQAMTQALGISPEDCVFSRDIVKTRYPEDET